MWISLTSIGKQPVLPINKPRRNNKYYFSDHSIFHGEEGGQEEINRDHGGPILLFRRLFNGGGGPFINQKSGLVVTFFTKALLSVTSAG